MLDVHYKVSLRPSGHDAHWSINKDKGTITFNLPRHFFYNDEGEDYDIEYFMLRLIESELVERVCLERAYQKIRMKGRTRCKPYCCVEKIAAMMAYPDEWERIRKFFKHEVIRT